MSNLGHEKISHKVLRIFCLCLVLVVIGVFIGVYFITKKSVNDTFTLYKQVVANNISRYDENSLFEKDRDIVAKYTKSVALEMVVQDIVTDQEIANKEQDKADALSAGDATKVAALEEEIEDLKNKQHYNLLQTQYKQLLIFANAYFDNFIEDLAKQNKSLNRSKMNNLYSKVEAVESKINTFQEDKIQLEQKTNTGHGTTFDVSESNTIAVLKEHMKSYVDLIESYVELNKTFASVHIELNGLTNALNDYNAKIILSYAVMYATSYLVITEFEPIVDDDEYFTDITTEAETAEIFKKLTELYNLSTSTKGVKATTDVASYSYIYNRTKNVYSELDNLTECAKQQKTAIENSENLDNIYLNTLKTGKQNVLTFLDAVSKVVVSK